MIALVALLVAQAASPAPAPLSSADIAARLAAAGVSAAELARLEEGELVAETNQETAGARGEGRGSVLVHRPEGELWRILTDHRRFPEFMPRIEKVQVLDETPGGERSQLWLDATVKHIDYALDYRYRPEAGVIVYSMAKDPPPHGVKEASGTWRLIPVDAGASTVVVYASKIDIGFWVPGFVAEYLSKRSIPNVLEAVKRRAEAGFGKK